MCWIWTDNRFTEVECADRKKQTYPIIFCSRISSFGPKDKSEIPRKFPKFQGRSTTEAFETWHKNVDKQRGKGFQAAAKLNHQGNSLAIDSAIRDIIQRKREIAAQEQELKDISRGIRSLPPITRREEERERERESEREERIPEKTGGQEGEQGATGGQEVEQTQGAEAQKVTDGFDLADTEDVEIEEAENFEELRAEFIKKVNELGGLTEVPVKQVEEAVNNIGDIYEWDKFISYTEKEEKVLRKWEGDLKQKKFSEHKVAAAFQRTKYFCEYLGFHNKIAAKIFVFAQVATVSGFLILRTEPDSKWVAISGIPNYVWGENE